MIYVLIRPSTLLRASIRRVYGQRSQGAPGPVPAVAQQQLVSANRRKQPHVSGDLPVCQCWPKASRGFWTWLGG